MEIGVVSWWWGCVGERSEVGAKNRLLNVIRFFGGGGSWGWVYISALPPSLSHTLAQCKTQ